MPLLPPVFHLEPFLLHLQCIELLQVPFWANKLPSTKPGSLPVSFHGLEAPWQKLLPGGSSPGMAAGDLNGSLGDTPSDQMPLYAQTSSDKGVHDGAILDAIWVFLPGLAECPNSAWLPSLKYSSSSPVSWPLFPALWLYSRSCNW